MFKSVLIYPLGLGARMEVKFSGLVIVLDLELFAKILEKDLPPDQIVFLLFFSHLVY